MFSLLEEIDSLIPPTYEVQYNVIDESKKDTITLIEEKIKDTNKELVEEGKTITNNIQFYMLVSKNGANYKNGIGDLYNIYKALSDREGELLGDKRIVSVSGFNVTPTGVLKNKQSFSMDLSIEYYVK